LLVQDVRQSAAPSSDPSELARALLEAPNAAASESGTLSMQYRTLGKAGWRVSAVGMGCWGIGGQWGPTSEETARATLLEALDRGINLFDTADIYGALPGISEAIIGRTFQGRRDQVLIATKVGNYGSSVEAPIPFTSWLHVKLCCEASLFRLKTDYIDLLQCHRGHAGPGEIDVFVEGFSRLQEAGLIRAWGVSTDRLDVLQGFDSSGACATCQFDYNLLTRRAELGLLPYCEQNGIGTLVRRPLASGALSAKFTPETTFEDAVRSGWNQGEGRREFLRTLDLVSELRFLAADRPMSHAALQFVLAHPAVSCVVPGARRPEQIIENAAAAEGTLTGEELLRAQAVTPPAPSRRTWKSYLRPLRNVLSRGPR
jgi:myo-inositol catabolism protein IolS